MDTIEKAIQELGRLGRGAVQSPVARAPIKQQGEELAPDSVPLAVSPIPTVSSKRNGNKRTRRAVALDLERIRQAGMVVPDDQRSRIKEEYRNIKRPLLMNASGKGAIATKYANLIMVTSARPGEGKTFTAINLALSIALERDRTVLLIDADVVKPMVSKFFGFSSGLGLVDFLVKDNLELADALVETNIPSLTILPAGTTHHLSTELLASENMRQLAHEMSMRYSDRIVIFDSPPLLATTEARVLASIMGQIVMVIEAERTRQSQIKEALALLDPDTIVGCVLNKTRSSMGSDYYYGPYYYGGNHGQEQE